MSTSAHPTNATQAKERLFAQLAASLNQMSRAVSQTADLMEQLQIDLHAMRTFAGLDAAKFMVVADNLKERLEPENEVEEEEGKSTAMDDAEDGEADKSESDHMEA